MAIKIISKPVGKPVYQGQCIWCHCRFEFEHSDANTFCDDQREGFSYNVTCPDELKLHSILCSGTKRSGTV